MRHFLRVVLCIVFMYAMLYGGLVLLLSGCDDEHWGNDCYQKIDSTGKQFPSEGCYD